MSDLVSPVVEPLSGNHNRRQFRCGVDVLDEYIQRYANQDSKRRISRTFVAIIPGSSDIIGYYTLSAASFSATELPQGHAKKLPHYPVPAALIGRLAVDQSWHGKKVGRLLLIDAMDRVLKASMAMGIYAIIVEAKDKSAVSFYEQYGFVDFTGDQLRLFLTIQTIQKI